MNIVLLIAMWIQQCVGKVYIVCVPLEYPSYGVVMMCAKRINQWTNPIWVMYKGPILWGQEACYKEPDAWTEDQFYWTVYVHVPMHSLKWGLYVKYEGPVIWELNMQKE